MSYLDLKKVTFTNVNPEDLELGDEPKPLTPTEVKEIVGPLVEALKWCDECHITGNFGCVQNALAHARAKGWA